MKKLCFATNNPGKIAEIKGLLGGKFEILSLADIGCDVDLPEEQDTMEGNSSQKARYVYDHFGVDCFADDSGLEVDALNGAPGVYSARFAGPQRKDSDNIDLLLTKLQGNSQRGARFRTVITLIEGGKETQFTGTAEGDITEARSGEKGFGYDPVFRPEGMELTFAEISAEEKNRISHRGKAVRSLVEYLAQK
ncbi:RdgB/HAM1 family non-canonical purine NTP pyrophosphatase [Fulvitalea axinellae]